MKRSRQFLVIATAFMALLLAGCSAGSSAYSNGNAADKGNGGSDAQATLTEDTDALNGTWSVGAVEYKGKIVDVFDVSALADLYSGYSLAFDGQGSFTCLNTPFRITGTYECVDDDNTFLLKTESVAQLTEKDGKLSAEETDSEKKTYIVQLMDDKNTLSYGEYDALTDRMKADDSPLYFVREGAQSAFIEENKASVGSSGSSSKRDSKTVSSDQGTNASNTKPSGSKSSASNSASSSSSGDLELVNEFDTANGKGYQGNDGNYYFKNDDGSIEATDGMGNGVRDEDGDGEADMWTNDGGETWHRY